MHENAIVLTERMKWLTARIVAKKSVGWDTEWDERERKALEWALHMIKNAAPWRENLLEAAL